MIQWLSRAYDVFRGIDPPDRVIAAMDGPLHPNTVLDDAPVLVERDGIGALCATPDGLFAASGAELLSLTGDAGGLTAEVVQRMPEPITFLASDGAGALAIGQDGNGVLIRGGAHDGMHVAASGGVAFGCPTAAVFAGPDTLILANGSAAHRAGEWKHDLMRQNRSGSVWRIELASPVGGATALAEGLRYPSGLALARDGRLLVSEAWAHRVVSLSATEVSAPVEVLAELPAYPGAILATEAGEFWLSLFAPRNPLVEFVIGERRYCEKMIATVPSDYWIAPALSGGRSFLEPIQGGARKKLNTLKPWSPSWSYGLALHCDTKFSPLASVHSRADGSVHGVTSCAERDGRLLVAATGSGRIVGVDPGMVIGIGVAR